MKKKGILSTLLIILIITCFVTGAALFFIKSGMIFMFSRHLFLNIHAYGGFLMTALVAYHFWLNRKIYFAEIKSKKNDKNKIE